MVVTPKRKRETVQVACYIVCSGANAIKIIRRDMFDWVANAFASIWFEDTVANLSANDLTMCLSPHLRTGHR